jgi:hypothetical protein
MEFDDQQQQLMTPQWLRNNLKFFLKKLRTYDQKGLLQTNNFFKYLNLIKPSLNCMFFNLIKNFNFENFQNFNFKLNSKYVIIKDWYFMLITYK